MDETRDTPATPLSNLGPALRRLRMKRGLRQYEAADAADITKAMLSAYETGKRRPSVRTLDRLLAGLDAHLGDLYRAMAEDRRAAEIKARREAGEGGAERLRAGSTGFMVGEGGAAFGSGSRTGAVPWYDRLGPTFDLYELLGVDGPLPAEEERALRDMASGFLRLLRFMHQGLASSRRPAAAAPAEGVEGGEGED